MAPQFIGNTLWLFNIAMENGSFIDDFPSIKTTIEFGDSPWQTVSHNQMVYGKMDTPNAPNRSLLSPLDSTSVCHRLPPRQTDLTSTRDFNGKKKREFDGNPWENSSENSHRCGKTLVCLGKSSTSTGFDTSMARFALGQMVLQWCYHEWSSDLERGPSCSKASSQGTGRNPSFFRGRSLNCQ